MEQHTLSIMGVTCNYFIALKIPKLLVSVYCARAWHGHKLQPLGLASTAPQSRIGLSFLLRDKTTEEDNGWWADLRLVFCCSTEVVGLTQMVTLCFETVQSGDGHIQLYQLRDNNSESSNRQ